MSDLIPTAITAGQPRPDRPSVLLLHGIGGRAFGWQAQLDALASQGWHALAWDMPGYGDSPMLLPYTFDALADAAAELLDAHAVPHAVVVGHSLGGMVALQLWARHPQRVASLMLAGSSPAFGHGSGDFQQQFLAQRLAPLDAGQTLAQVAERLIPAMVAPGFAGPGLALAQACMGSIAPASYRAALHALVTFEQRAALPTITVPTLCLAGEHDRTASPAVVRRMADKIPGARYTELAGAGHLMNFEAPEAFTQALLGFLHTTQEETQP